MKIIFQLYPENTDHTLLLAIDKSLAEIAHHDFNDIKTLNALLQVIGNFVTPSTQSSEFVQIIRDRTCIESLFLPFLKSGKCTDEHVLINLLHVVTSMTAGLSFSRA
jgi:hypothetical protein